MAGMARSTLVGREEPLRRLTRVLDEACTGIGRLALVSGEPGVGKTRLALELLDVARDRGARTAVGTCWDGAGAPGLWPWVQLLRSVRDELGPDAWDGASRHGQEAIGRLLDADGHGEADEFHLLEAILQLLTSVCDDRPLVVLLDDLQWADAASVSLMTFLHRHAVHLPLLMVGTYRTDEVARPDLPVRDSLADLAQQAITIPLSGLDNDGIRQVRKLLGVPTSIAEAEHLRRLTGGNPFFVIESAAFLDPTESLGVRRAIERRVDALGDTERHVLTVASLIGREVDDEIVAEVVGDGARDALAVIEQAGLMRADDGRHGFVHDLVRESMRDRLSADDRRRLYAAIVEVTDRPNLRTRLLPAQLAWLATEAVPDTPPERAVALLEAAADDALARLTYEQAARHLERAAELTTDPIERARLTLESGHARERAGDLEVARGRFTELLTAEHVEVRARALLGLHRLGDPAASGDTTEVLRLLDEIDVDLRPTSDAGLRAEVMAARSRSRSHLLDVDRSNAVAMAEEALEVARSTGAHDTIAACLLAYHDALWEPGTEPERWSVADELATIGRDHADTSMLAQGLILRMVAEIESGDAAYRATHLEFDAVAEASQSPRLRYLAASRRGMIAALHADLELARTEIDEARGVGDRIGEPDAVGVWCDQRWQVARHTGDVATVTELLATLRDHGDPHWMVYEAMVAADLGDVERTRWVKPKVMELGRRWPRWAARLWDAFNTDLAIVEHDDDAIEQLIDHLTPDAGHWAVLGGGVIVHGPVALRLSRLEAARGEWERALAWALDAEQAASQLDATLWLLEARADRLAAQHVLGTIAPADIAATIALARDRGLEPIVERLERLTAAPARQSSNVFRRERDVWTLGFDGIEVRMPDAKGLRDLHALLANPGVEIPAAKLATEAVVSTDAQPVLDERAKQAYRRRLDEFDHELDRAARRGDAAKGAALEKERAVLIDELRRASGLGGRDRSINSDGERLRKTVTARIRDTLRRVDDRHPALATHLRESVRTGTMCSYAPAVPIRWDLESVD
jgi:hypothetical protein